jgi:hypothetical protein
LIHPGWNRVDDSLTDETQREFLIGFYLHNRDAREWEVDSPSRNRVGSLLPSSDR